MPAPVVANSLRSPVKFCGMVSMYSDTDPAPDRTSSARSCVKTGLATYSRGSPRISEPVTITSLTASSLVWDAAGPARSLAGPSSADDGEAWPMARDNAARPPASTEFISPSF